MMLSPSNKRSKLSHRFAALMVVFALGYIIYGVWSFKTLNELKVTGPLYQRIALRKDLIGEILPPRIYIIESYLVTLQLLDAGDKAEKKVLIESLKKLRREYDERYKFWLANTLDDDRSDQLLTQSHLSAEAFYAIAFNELVPAIQKDDRRLALAATARMKPLYERHRKAIDQITQLTQSRVEANEVLAKERIRSASLRLLAILVASMGLSIGGAAAILRGLQQPLKRLARAAERLTLGDFNAVLPTASDDDLGSLVHAFAEMREKRQRTEEELLRTLHLATHDTLTGLSNRYLLNDRIEQALTRLPRSHRHAAVLFIDLDGLKAINDTLGHNVGDELLKEAAQRFIANVRNEDTVARLGGDEFVVLLPDVLDAQAAERVGHKLLSALAAPCRINGQDLQVSASIGIVVSADDGSGDDVDTLLKNSDVAMYYAKKAGRSHCMLFEPRMNL